MYHRPGVELPTKVVDPENALFASEMLGAVPRGKDPDTGYFRTTPNAMSTLSTSATPIPTGFSNPACAGSTRDWTRN